MLNMERPRPGSRRLVAATAICTAMLMVASVTLASDTVTAEIETAERDLTTATATELRSVVADMSLQNEVLEADNQSLRQALDELSSEHDRLATSMRHFDDLYAPLEADRQLLFELRKGLPETRPEVEAQLKRMRSLAMSSDPSRLGRLLDRVEDAAPAFLDWRFTQFTTTQEATEAYLASGANVFETAMSEFRNAVLLSVGNRLDGLLNVLDRIR